MRQSPYGNVILISGASSGLGLAAARRLAAAGYLVLCCSRHPESKPETVGAGQMVPVKLDVRREQEVRETVEALLLRFDIGAVLHCAGVGIGGAAEDSPVDDVRALFETNFFGVLSLNRALMPHFRARRQGGLVLMTSSVAGMIPIPFQSAYSASKFALEAYGETLRMESRPFGVRVCLIEPGDTRTAFTQNRQMVIPEGSAYRKSCESSIAKMARDEQRGSDPARFAKLTEKLLRKKNPPVRKAVGVGYKILVKLKGFLPARLAQWVLGKLYVPLDPVG